MRIETAFVRRYMLQPVRRCCAGSCSGRLMAALIIGTKIYVK